MMPFLETMSPREVARIELLNYSCLMLYLDTKGGANSCGWVPDLFLIKGMLRL